MKGKKISLEMVAIAAIAFGAEQIRQGNIKVGAASALVGLVAVVAYEVLQEKQIGDMSVGDIKDATDTINEYLGREKDGGSK